MGLAEYLGNVGRDLDNLKNKAMVMASIGLASTGIYVELSNAQDVRSRPINMSAIRDVSERRALVEDIWRRDYTLTRRENIERIVDDMKRVVATSSVVATIDPSWSYEDINGLLDGDPDTFGKAGAIDPVFGQTVRWEAGVYMLPVIPGGNPSYELKIDGVILSGPLDPMVNRIEDTAVLMHDPQTSSPGAILRGCSSHNVFANLNLRQANVGISMEENYSNILVYNVNACSDATTSLDKIAEWQAEYNQGSNLLPSIIFSDTIGETISKGYLFGLGAEPTTLDTKWAAVLRVTLRDIGAFGIQPPHCLSTCEPDYSGPRIILGLEDFIDNLFLDSDGVPFIPEIYEGSPAVSGVTGFISTDSVPGPKRNDEWNVGLSDPNFQTLASLGIGEGNFDTNPFVNIYFRPAWGTDAVGPRFPKGHAGALHAPHDTNENGILDISDFNDFKISFYDPSPSYETITIHDVVGQNGNPPDGNITTDDFNEFIFHYENQNGPQKDCNENGRGDLEDILLDPNLDMNNNGVLDSCFVQEGIPTVSEWGLATLSLMLLTAGTILIRGRKHYTGLTTN